MYSRSAKGGEKGDPNRNPWLAKMRNDRLNEFVMLIYIYNKCMRSCNERTTLHCVESYLYYIILVNKKIFSEE